MFEEIFIKLNDTYFEEAYVAKKGVLNHKTWKYENREVRVFLDNDCVRYVGFINGKQVTRCEYNNNHKDTCKQRALAWLNK